MDNIKGDKSKDFMKPYHYANFPKGFRAADREGANIVHVLNNTILELGAKYKLTKDEIKTKIPFLFHLVGDLHQPLHLGYENDKGGNTVQLNYQTRGTNLHSFWDSGIITSQNITLQDCLGATTYTPEELKVVKKINVVGWSNESRALLPRYMIIKIQKFLMIMWQKAKRPLKNRSRKRGFDWQVFCRFCLRAPKVIFELHA